MAIHGKHNVELRDNILFVKLIGSFNCEGIEAYIETVKHYVSQLRGRPFAMLIDDLALEGGTPEAYLKLDDYNAWLARQSIIAKAFVINSIAVREILLERTPALQEHQIEFFQDMESAEVWVKEKVG